MRKEYLKWASAADEFWDFRLQSVSPVFSVAYLCDRIINELCLYLCTSSNRGRWAAVIALSCGSPSCQMRFEPRPRRALVITNVGEVGEVGGIHSGVNFGLKRWVKTVSGSSAQTWRKRRSWSQECVRFLSVVVERHTVGSSSYYHFCSCQNQHSVQ